MARKKAIKPEPIEEQPAPVEIEPVTIHAPASAGWFMPAPAVARFRINAGSLQLNATSGYPGVKMIRPTSGEYATTDGDEIKALRTLCVAERGLIFEIN